MNARRPGTPVPGRPLALLVVDMINPMDFPHAAAMLPQAVAAARNIARLKRRLRGQGVPVIYANDNFADWRMDFRELVAVCSHDTAGAQMARTLAPLPDDHFVLKPRHSAFFDTPLPTLLAQLGTRRLVVTGIATDGCVLATALDAHLREFQVHVPRDCVAAISPERTARALQLVRDAQGIDVRLSRFASTGG